MRSYERINALALAALAVTTSAASAQTIRGTVVDRDGAVPLSGAFVSLVDSVGVTQDGAFTSASGTFLLSAPRPGVYSIEVAHIGFEEWASSRYDLTIDQAVELRIEIGRRPVALADLEVRVVRSCFTDPSQADALDQVWAEARTALETSILVQEDPDLRFDTSEYDRVLDPRSLVVRESTDRARNRVRLPPFRAPSTEMLTAEGFARFPGDTVVYYAPDAAVLLSDAFHASHCFGLARDEVEGERFIGLTFTPRPERAVPEIEGVMWLAEETAELRRVEFQYVYVPVLRGVDRRLLAGEVVFKRLPNGPFYVSDWWLRLPISGRYHVDLPGADRSRKVLAGYKETGGAVTAAYLGRRAIIGRRSQVLDGVVRDSVTGDPVSGARVSLRDGDRAAPESEFETRYVAIADSVGRFQIAGVAPGTYAAEVRRPDWEPLELPPFQRLLTVEREPGPVELFARSEEDAYAGLCPGSPLHRGEGAIIGLLNAMDGRPLASEEVQARWVVPRISVSPDGTVLTQDEARYERATTDENGFFVLCGLPGREELVLRATTSERGIAMTVDRRISRRDLFVDR